MPEKIKVLITDLDNTLFDWVEIWYESFSAMLDQLVRDSGVPRKKLINEIKKIHEKYGTSEYAFLIEELPSLQELHQKEDIISIYDEAIHRFRSQRKKYLRLFPRVEETLMDIRKKGTLVVGYTESMAFYSNHRVRNLGLDERLDYLYSPADHDLPKGLTPEQIRKYPAEQYELSHCEHRNTPPGELKPNPKMLLDIISDLGARPDECIYVGDNLMKDVVMAQEAGVTDIHAAYGEAHHRDEYQLLRDVTHWPDKHVQQEKKLSPEHVKPRYSLENSFGELLEFFEFSKFKTRGLHGQEN
ncbi:MAG: HAD-IA family hydrolase [Proteobacteria bacterium]|nr:HAD-IA family hydrolase [Pseudomonadota bacterium]